jgi:hypothetical protein
LGTPVSSDNCGVASVTNNAPSTYPIGETTVTWTAEDNSGNVTTCDQLVTVSDVTAPVANLSVLANVIGECSATPTAPTATDFCAGLITGTPDVQFPITNQGTTIVTWTYDDGNGNTASQTQNVILTDITAPTITCPAPVNFSLDAASCSATGYQTVVYDIPLSQIEGGVLQYNGINCNGGQDVYVCGDYMGISWTDAGSLAPSSVSVEYYQNFNGNGSALSTTFNSIADNDYNTIDGFCSNNTVNQSLNPANYIVGGVNTVMINSLFDCLLWEENASWSNAYARVTVIYPGQISLGTPVSNDNCGVASVTNNAPSTYPIGVTTVTWTAEDNSGNVTTCDQLVTVSDVISPTITCSAPVNF